MRMRPTIWPMRPKPAMITGAIVGLDRSYSGGGFRHQARDQQPLGGREQERLASIESAMTRIAPRPRFRSARRRRRPAPNSTKLNSLPWERAMPKRAASAQSSPAMRPSTQRDQRLHGHQADDDTANSAGSLASAVQVGRRCRRRGRRSRAAGPRTARCRRCTS